MRKRWSRERILRAILEREAQGHALNAKSLGRGRDQLYGAARRIFGSWRNALLAAGIPPERVLPSDRWPPWKVLAKIRYLARRRRPLSNAELERRYKNLAPAACRHFGSWTKAAVAAGVDPIRLRRVVPWSRERVIEAILKRALRGEMLARQLVQPRSLVDAGDRHFGSWAEAVAAAGLDRSVSRMAPRRTKRLRRVNASRPRKAARPRRGYSRWTIERVIEGIRALSAAGQPLNGAGVDARLYDAGRRHLGNWDAALAAAGLDPADHRRGGKVIRLQPPPELVSTAHQEATA